jgi:hypothetical protein
LYQIWRTDSAFCKHPELAKAHSELFDCYQVLCKVVEIEGISMVLLRVSNFTPSLNIALKSIQRHCYSTLTNALSHERTQPLQSIVDLAKKVACQELNLSQIRAHAR